jgi:hypothetical protein
MHVRPALPHDTPCSGSSGQTPQAQVLPASLAHEHDVSA